GVARLRAHGDGKEGGSPQYVVALRTVGIHIRQRNHHVQLRILRARRVERQGGPEPGEASGEHFAVVLAGERKGRTGFLLVVGRHHGWRGEHGRHAGERGQPRTDGHGGGPSSSQPRGNMRASVASPRNRWCQVAAAPCARTRIARTQNRFSCRSCMRLARPSSGATSLGTTTWPNQRNGRRPLAESMSQPDSGIASTSAYSSQWVTPAAMRCGRDVPGTGAGAPAYARQPRRNSISASTNRPTDLCRSYTQ